MNSANWDHYPSDGVIAVDMQMSQLRPSDFVVASLVVDGRRADFRRCLVYMCLECDRKLPHASVSRGSELKGLRVTRCVGRDALN